MIAKTVFLTFLVLLAIIGLVVMIKALFFSNKGMKKLFGEGIIGAEYNKDTYVLSVVYEDGEIENFYTNYGFGNTWHCYPSMHDVSNEYSPALERELQRIHKFMKVHKSTVYHKDVEKIN